jgi:hypothetical protein
MRAPVRFLYDLDNDHQSPNALARGWVCTYQGSMLIPALYPSSFSYLRNLIMLNLSNPYFVHSYELGFSHGLIASIPYPFNADAYYRIGFDIARKQAQV